MSADRLHRLFGGLELFVTEGLCRRFGFLRLLAAGGTTVDDPVPAVRPLLVPRKCAVARRAPLRRHESFRISVSHGLLLHPVEKTDDSAHEHGPGGRESRHDLRKQFPSITISNGHVN